MRSWVKLGSMLAATMLAAGLLAACGGGEETKPGGEAASGTVDVTLAEWSVKPSAAKAKAGEVKFKVTNKGATPHELAIVKTDTDSAKLTVAGAAADEKAVKVIGRTASLDGGKSETKEFKLDAGKYALICNLPAHYGQGMHAPFTVE